MGRCKKCNRAVGVLIIPLGTAPPLCLALPAYMRILHAIIAVLLLTSSLGLHAVDPADEEWDYKATGPNAKTSWEGDTGDILLTGGGRVRYRDTVMTADRASFNQATGDVKAEGNVRIERLGEVWIGDKLEYNFKTRRFSGEKFRTGQMPFFAAGEHLHSDLSTRLHTADHAILTTDDYAEPGYYVQAKRITIVPGEYIKAEQATIRVGKMPVFYLPVWTRSLKRHPNNWVLLPGYRSRFGPYLLSSYHYHVNDEVELVLDLDARQKRGFGYGPEIRYDLPEIGKGQAKYYFTHDDLPGLDSFQRPINDQRQRAWFDHQWSNSSSNLTVKGAVRYQSDAQVIRDFFEAEYRRNVQPSSYVELEKSWRNWSLNSLVQPRVNDFFDTVERLPDLRLSGLRQELGNSTLYYESESSVGYYRRLFGEGSTNAFSAGRGDSYHQLTLPRTFFNWLNVTPRVGGRGTYYSEVDGVNSSLGEQHRFVFNTGAEVSTKASRVWRGASNRFFEIDGLRHILEPSINYVFVPSPTRSPLELPQFDYELPARRLLPIEYPDYNAIDSVDSQNVLRLGFRNKLQTKRNERVDDVVAWSLFTDWRLKPRSNQGTFADLFSDLDVVPFHWLSVSSELRYNLDDGYWKEANHYLTLLPNSVWSFSVGHRYYREDARLGPDSGHNLISTKLYYRLSENWGFRSIQHFEARDGKMEEQMYTVYRDFRSWTGALTFRVRESRTSEARDYTVGIVFNLKAFPHFKLGEDVNEPSLLFGR